MFSRRTGGPRDSRSDMCTPPGLRLKQIDCKGDAMRRPSFFYIRLSHGYTFGGLIEETTDARLDDFAFYSFISGTLVRRRHQTNHSAFDGYLQSQKGQPEAGSFHRCHTRGAGAI